MPFKASEKEELPDVLDLRYDTDGEERLFDRVPGAGVYLWELRKPDERLRNRNVIYASLGRDGEVEIRAMGWNRTGKKVNLRREGEVGFQEIESRSCFGDIWVGRGEIEVANSCAKRCLERKINFDWDRQQRFEEDVRGF